MDFIKMNFNFLELTYKSVINPKRKLIKYIGRIDINKKLFTKGWLEISKYDGSGIELYELESIIVK